MKNTTVTAPVLKDDIACIVDSGLFELNYYSRAAGKAFYSLESAVQHYLVQGAAEKLNPGEYFDTGWYLATNADVAKTNLNPLIHFIKFGHVEGRRGRAGLKNEVIQQVDELISAGCMAQARQLLNNLQADSTLLLDAIALRQLKCDYYCADTEQGFNRIAKLQLDWSWLTHSVDYQQLLKIKVYWLLELGQASEARAELTSAIRQHMGWSACLEWYKDFVETAEDLQCYQALLAPFMLKRNYASAQARLLFAAAAKSIMAYQQAFEALEQRWYILQSLRQKPQVGPKVKSDWSELAATALKSLKKLMDAQGQPFFLISGTLLGCIRENALLPHDKDIDVGVFEDIDLVQIATVLRRSGCFLIQHQQHARVLQVKHINGVLIDIFQHWREDGQYIHAGQKTRWRNSIFTLKPVDFLGETFLIPDPAEVYLTENYGNWQQPKVDYDTFTDTPNMDITNLQDLQFHYLKVLPEHLLRGNIRSFKRIWSVYRKKFQPSWRMRLAFVAAVSSWRLKSIFPTKHSH